MRKRSPRQPGDLGSSLHSAVKMLRDWGKAPQTLPFQLLHWSARGLDWVPSKALGRGCVLGQPRKENGGGPWKAPREGYGWNQAWGRVAAAYRDSETCPHPQSSGSACYLLSQAALPSGCSGFSPESVIVGSRETQGQVGDPATGRPPGTPSPAGYLWSGTD